MPSTFQALAVALLALLPGALYELAREQRSGRWGLRGTDQILRLLGFSVLFQVIIAPLTYWLYGHYIVTGHFADGKAVSCWLWVGLVAYLAVPFVFGRFTAWGYSNRDAKTSGIKKASAKLVGLYTDTAPAPRAWDYMWNQPQLGGWVVLHLKDGSKIGGEWNGSYAAGYPEAPDLYIADQVELDQEGKFLVDSDRMPTSLGKSLLIRWDEVKYLDFFDGRVDGN